MLKMTRAQDATGGRACLADFDGFDFMSIGKGRVGRWPLTATPVSTAVGAAWVGAVRLTLLPRRRPVRRLSLATRFMPMATLLCGAIALGFTANAAEGGEVDAPTNEGEVEYIGGMVDGVRHGRGTLSWNDGRHYVGEFRRGQPHGLGVYTWANGDVYEGTLAGGVPEGEGVYRYADGAFYQGHFENGTKAGRGTLVWENGNRYDGYFVAGERHGLGHFRWRDGTVYRGRFAFDRQHGPGVKASVEGALFFQKWNDGELLAERPIDAVARCALNLDRQPWMFEGSRCINGLAHGDGDAVRLDGLRYIVDGRFVLGRLVRGTPMSLALE